MRFIVKNSNPFESVQECLMVGLYDTPGVFTGMLQQLDQAYDRQLTELVKSGDISTKRKAVSVVHGLGKTGLKRIVFIGLGKEKDIHIESLREAFGRASKKINKFRIESAAIVLDSFVTDGILLADIAQTFSEAFLLSTYQFNGYREKMNEPYHEIKQMDVFTTQDSEELNMALIHGEALGEGVNAARTLVNTPGNLLKASDIAQYAQDLASRFDFEVEILSKEQLEELGMGALLAVNRGSEEPPFMITIKYQGKETWDDVIGLVGKGVTFDTGGYSIKPKDGIIGMKMDMGGAASVLGVMEIIGKLCPKQNVVAVIPTTDNMISGRSFKPDDVITSYSGKTIEVLNTDAEGRLVLADAITYAIQHGANYLVDVATLTGGVIIALGNDKTGALTNDEEWFDKVLSASKQAGEFIWQLPYTEKDKARVRNSKVADLNNSPGREGHAIMGGAFIGEFVEDTPWVHLDIAGTAVTKQDHDLGPAGATGVMVRTLALLIKDFAK